jgi:hypothetical protein
MELYTWSRVPVLNLEDVQGRTHLEDDLQQIKDVSGTRDDDVSFSLSYTYD